MFNETTLRERLLPSSDIVNDYVAHIKRKCADLNGNNRTYDLDEKKLCNATN